MSRVCCLGYNGTQCESDIDECLDSPCRNEAKCANVLGSFTCDCHTGYVGHTCHSVNPCNDTDYCDNDGNCTYEVDDIGKNVSGLCDCVLDWEGPRCALYVSGEHSQFTRIFT